MRSHGVSDFPDPGSNGARPSGNISTIFGITIPSNLNVQSPRFQSALQSCQKLVTGGGPKPQISASQKRAALANAQCMRKHGVPNFSDPTFPTGGGAAIRVGPGVNPQSPAFQQAEKVCGSGR
jgi:hypothetical protein